MFSVVVEPRLEYSVDIVKSVILPDRKSSFLSECLFPLQSYTPLL